MTTPFQGARLLSTRLLLLALCLLFTSSAKAQTTPRYSVKPAASDVVQYIGLNGVDTNSGFSMGDPLGNADVANAFTTALANISANSDHGGQIYVLPGVYPFTGNVQLPITGHTVGTAKYKTAIHIHCIGQVVFQPTSGFTGDLFNQVITDTGQQSDQGATIDGSCIFDAGQTSGAAARTAWRFGGTEHTYIGPNVEFRNFVNPNNSITNVSANGTTATITASNNYVVNELVVVSTGGHELLNGVWPVQSATGTSFTIPTNQTITSVADTGVTAEWSSPVVVQNATGMNTNDWTIDSPKFLTNQVDITSMGPATNCLGGSPSSSQDQHFYIRGWFGMSVTGSRANIGIAAICGIAMSRGTINMSSSLNDPNDHVMSTDLQSYIAQVSMTDNMENNTGGTATRYLAPAVSNTPETAGTISLSGTFLNLAPFANEGTTSGQLICGEDLTNNVFKCPTVVLPSSGGGTITHQAPNTAAAVAVTDPIATTLSPVVGTCTMTTTTCTITVVSGAAHCVATDSGGTIAGQCAISGTTLTVTAASSNTSAWSVLWW